MNDESGTEVSGGRSTRLLVAGALVVLSGLSGFTWGRATAAPQPDPPWVLRDGAGEVRLAISMARDSAVGLTLHDAEGRIRLILGVRGDGSPFARMLNAFGNPVWTAP